MIKKRAVTYLTLLIFLTTFILAQSPSSEVDSSGVDDIQEKIDKIPINSDGELEFPEADTTKAEERIATLNKMIGPITNLLFGQELSLTWTFVFAFIVWILLIEIIVLPVSEIFKYNLLGSLFVATIISTIAMRSLGNNFVAALDALATSWQVGLIVFVVMGVFAVFYKGLMHVLGEKYEKLVEEAAKSKTNRDRQIIHVDAQISKKELED